MESAITNAEEAVKTAHAAALDLHADPIVARTIITDAELARDRLRNALPQLQERQRQLWMQESAEAWDRAYREAQPQQQALIAELTEVYQRASHEIADVLARIDAFERGTGHRIDSNAPSSEHRRLGDIELAARGLKS